MSAADVSRLALYPRETGGLVAGETARSVIEAVEAKGVVSRVSPLSVAQPPNAHSGRALCHTTGINGTLKYNGFCFDEVDEKTSAWSGGWHNQGLTASHDADASGKVDGAHLYMASWYYGTGDAEADRNKKARISIVQSTGTAWTYGHVLLVQPTGSRANPNFTSVNDIHADGIVWYGDRLFVANGGELQIYDLNHLWQVNSVSGGSGVSGSTSAAEWHQWALPMVARYSNRTKAQQDAAPWDKKSDMFCDWPIACLNSLSLDRGVTPPRLVSGRFSGERAKAVVARWPVDEIGEGRSAPVTAEAAYVAPTLKMQGVATDGYYYYMAADCEDHLQEFNVDPVATHNPQHPFTCIWQATPGGRLSFLTRVPPLTQNLSFSQQSGRLWGMSEVNNHRAVFSLLPRAADRYEYLWNDYSRLCTSVYGTLHWNQPVKQSGCDYAEDERWQFEETEDNNGDLAYFIRSTFSGVCMTPRRNLGNGARIVQYSCDGDVDKKWWWNPVTHEIRNVYSGKCLGLGAEATNGSPLIQWPCNGLKDERWSKGPVPLGS
ncbi:RICIN domain-containing protein [Kitasatospora purpeofusca]|uniref:RICIN domain-containing protein n=1 Tax=Kitasatospora purpeofusca TaxID=67352 RepID=A0ABZ1UB47_9ACTN|nr:RICIN domain-containing protein [Kitasatospora purpeofusca]